ncbi:hypothetical protein JOD97_004591 [Duganella sp. 1411]|nr:hypothetical protein [Duganella sp. 1411]
MSYEFKDAQQLMGISLQLLTRGLPKVKNR